tara:strand:+ start:1434 stop:1640 length:207 start_codon:yes stop_codon:yes gene_type:complete
MGSSPIVIAGIILVIFGIIFSFQGQGVVGPETSFMYESQDWIDYGMWISMIGVILVLIGYVVEKRKQV